MIISTLKEIGRYYGLDSNLDKAIEYIQNIDLFALPQGTHDIMGKNIYFMRQSYRPIPQNEGTLEGHKQYVDIQIILKGIEGMGYVSAQNEHLVQVKEPYNAEKDIVKCGTHYLDTIAVLKEGMLAIVFPEDYHQPKIEIQPIDVEKLVLKVKLVKGGKNE